MPKSQKNIGLPMLFTQDELNEYWDQIQENRTFIHRQVLNEDNVQKMTVHVDSDVSSYGNHLANSVYLTYSRLKSPSATEFGSWKRMS